MLERWAKEMRFLNICQDSWHVLPTLSSDTSLDITNLIPRAASVVENQCSVLLPNQSCTNDYKDIGLFHKGPTTRAGDKEVDPDSNGSVFSFAGDTFFQWANLISR